MKLKNVVKIMRQISKIILFLCRCDTPLKGIKHFCEEKQKCLENNFEEEMKIRTQGTLFLGTIIR